MRRLLEELLRERGYEVAVAGSGEEAVRLHVRRRFELLLVDWTLPGMSGLEVCREVRRVEPGDNAVIIVTTAKSQPEAVAEALDAGATDFLAKPIDPTTLETRLAVAERTVREARRRRDEQDVVRFTESRFKHLVQNLPGVAFQCEFDDQGQLRFCYVSRGLRKLLNITPEEALEDPGRVFRMLAGEDGGGASLFAPIHGLTTFLTPNDQTHVTLEDGTRKWIQVMGRPGLEKNGRAVFDGIMIDVTEHRRAQQALRASEAAFRSLTEFSPDSVLVLRSNRIVYANPQAGRYLGFESGADLLGRRITEFVVDLELVADEELSFTSARSEGSSAQAGTPVELRLTRLDGRVVVGEATDTPMVYEGQPSLLVVVRDLTERREMQSRLYLADRMASVGTLAAGVAHEINNPLSYMTANLRLTRELLEGPLDPERVDAMRQQLDDAMQGADRVRDIVLDLKTFSQVEPDECDEVVIAEVLESSINMCWNEIRHRARLEADLRPTPPVRMNASKLGQVFLNLLINASQAMTEERTEGNAIYVRTYTDELGNAVIEVQDTGEGVPEANLARMFDPFFTTKSSAGGTGLGLSICHNIIAAAGGEIAAVSAVGEGTTMRVLLPRAEPGARLRRNAPAFPLLLAAGPQANVVVIDDEPLVGRSILRALRDHDVRIYTSGREAVDHLCGAHRIDVVFCDLMMPEMSGMEVYDAVHRQRPEVSARFVFMTGGAFTPRSRAFLEHREHRCLAKPFELREIRHIVREFAAL